jgi:uncharacterized protein with HEPN domain
MKGKISDEIRLRHILDAIGFIEKFSVGKSKQDLYGDFMYRFSVERQLEIIGEAANNLSPDLISQTAMFPGRRSLYSETLSFMNILD